MESGRKGRRKTLLWREYKIFKIRLNLQYEKNIKFWPCLSKFKIFFLSFMTNFSSLVMNLKAFPHDDQQNLRT
jgi:hypothetical protein